MRIVRTFGHLIGGILLISGTSIGLSLLTLPIATVESNFYPTLLALFFCWLFMLATGLLVLETCIWMPKDANFITFSKRLLGKTGKISCWILYLFLFVSLMIIHIFLGGEAIEQLTQGTLPLWISHLLYVILFAPFVYFGTLWVDRYNLILIAGMFFAFLFLMSFSFPHVKSSLLMRMDWGKTAWIFPIAFTAFAYHGLIPTLYNYMNRNVTKMRLSIIFGTAIPFLIYILWEGILLNTHSFESSIGLHNTVYMERPSLNIYLHDITLLSIGQAFCFFAMLTSFLGISTAFVDFLSDGFKVGKKRKSRLRLCLLVFGIPTLLVWINPFLFIKALTLFGGIAVALLFGIMPITMVWAGRYLEGYSSLHQQLRGGKFTLCILAAFIVLSLILMISR